MSKPALCAVALVILVAGGAAPGALAAPLAAQTQTGAPAPALARVVILATGGTIAGAQPKEGDAGYRSGAVSIESLIAAVPGLAQVGLPGPHSTLYFRLSWDRPWQPGAESSLCLDGPVVPRAPPQFELEER
jgi:hypothetical protein